MLNATWAKRTAAIELEKRWRHSTCPLFCTFYSPQRHKLAHIIPTTLEQCLESKPDIPHIVFGPQTPVDDDVLTFACYVTALA
jgi:hypothetical protein